MQQVTSIEKAQVAGRSTIFLRSEAVAIRRQIHHARVAAGILPYSLAVFDDLGLLNYCQEVIAQGQGQPVRIDLTLDTPSDFSIVRRVWKQLENESIGSLTLRVCLTSLRETSDSLKQLIIDLDDHNPLSLHNKLETLSKQDTTVTSVMMTRRAPLFWPRQVALAFLTNSPQEVLFEALGKLTIKRDTRIIFLRGALPHLHERVARDFWKQAFATEIPEVISCDDRMRCAPLRLFETAQPTTLLVFPERMLPLHRAYYLRAFDMLLGLNYGGEASAALVLGPNNADLARIQRALEIVSPCVITRPLKRGDYPLHHHMVRKSETFVRRQLGIKTSPPIRFSERCYTYGTKHHAKLLAESIEQLPYLRNVVYTGAWFTPSVQLAMTSNPSLKWYCDTHDVFFVVDRDSNQQELRFMYSPERHKQRELGLLNNAHGVIAISEADRLSIESAGCTSEVIVESGSFSHAARGVDVQKGPKDPVFGFIGSNNKNNEKCLQMVFTSWWHAIVAQNAKAQLLIAGGICKSPVAEILEKEFPGCVQRLGFVDVLSEFYCSVQAMLSPIAVQGGLNFKSVEALMAGRPLLTNELGSRCIGSRLEGVCVVGADGEGIVEVMERLDDRDNLAQWRRAIHQQASLRFSDDVAYQHLLMKLRGVRNG